MADATAFKAPWEMLPAISLTTTYCPVARFQDGLEETMIHLEYYLLEINWNGCLSLTAGFD